MATRPRSPCASVGAKWPWDIGLALLKRVEADLIEVGAVEQFPKLEGRQMVMMIGPKKK